MCQATVVEFIEAALTRPMVEGKEVLEVGSYDRNGSVRANIEKLGCKKYWGVDLEVGPSVDEVCDATALIERFGEASFDIVICTEVVEHVTDWRETLRNLKAVVRPGGVLIVTTRSQGFPYHGFPTDFWRYEIADMQALFADFDIQRLESDPGPPGVFMLAVKPQSPRPPVDLSGIELYCILVGDRVGALTPAQERTWRIEWFVRRGMGRLFPSRKRQWTMVA